MRSHLYLWLRAVGIADGRGILAALVLEASGVWLGTRFLSSYEAGIHQIYRQKLLEAKVEDTVHSTVFDLGWKNAPHRTLTNSTIQMWKAAGLPQSGDRPKEGEILGYTATGEPVIRYSDTITRGETSESFTPNSSSGSDRLYL